MKNNELILKLNDQLPSSEAKRLFHGRGCRFAGWEQVNIELYPPVMWVMIYMAINEEQLLALLSEVKENASKWQISHIYIQRRFLPGNPVEVFMGDDSFIEVDLQVQEADLNYWVTLGKNQNTGLFLDMAAGRRWLQSVSEGMSVLNLFAYTCSLGLAAAAGGARQVVNLDMAKGAIKRGQQNLSLNPSLQGSVSFIAQDVFKMIKKLTQKGPFDMLVADPPSFQNKAFDVKKDYKKLLEKIKPALAADATLMLCLNSPSLGPDFLMDLVAELIPNAQFIERLDMGETFQDLDEDAALKVMIFKLQPLVNQ